MATHKIRNAANDGWDTLTIGGGGGGGGLASATQVVDLWNGSDAAQENYVGGTWGTGFIAAGATYTLFQDHTTSSAAVGAAVRVPGLIIPQGATISAATLRLNSYNSGWDDMSASVTAEDVDNAADFFTTTTLAPGSRPRVSATPISWSVSSTGTNTPFTSPDLSTLVQEIVDRPGWAPGNAICLILEPAIAAILTMRFDNGRSAADFDSAEQTYVPRFSVAWSTA